MKGLRLRLMVILLLVVGWTFPAHAGFPSVLKGAWEEQRGSRRLSFERELMIERSDSSLVVRGLVRKQGRDRLILRKKGFPEEWAFRVRDGILTLEPIGKHKDPETGGTFRRLDRVPPDLKLDPLPVARPKKLSPEQIQSIQTEIARRFTEEQELLKRTPQPRDEILQVQKENLGYLIDLVEDVGWLDADRFGAKTSVNTVIMAKHTHDLRLMLTLLPYAKRDLKDSGDGQTFAVLYDATQLELGRKQVYGTQVTKDEKGMGCILPLQDSREEASRRLVEMGLPDLDEYLKVLSQAFFPGQQQIAVCCP